MSYVSRCATHTHTVLYCVVMYCDLLYHLSDFSHNVGHVQELFWEFDDMTAVLARQEHDHPMLRGRKYQGTDDKRVVWGSAFHINDRITEHSEEDLAAMKQVIQAVLQRIALGQKVPMYIQQGT